MKRLAFACAVLGSVLTGCREVRVQSYAQGTTTILGRTQIAVIRSRDDLERFGLRSAVSFNHEFGVVLLMGPHRRTGWRQVVESIRASSDRVRIVAYERGPADEGEPSLAYRTYTLWIVPNLVYRAGSHVEVVTPSGDAVAQATLR